MTRRPAGTVGLTAALIALVGCFSGDPDPTATLPDECRALAELAGVGNNEVVIGIRDFSFVPIRTTVEPGTRVTWVNCEPIGTQGGVHTSTSDEGKWSSDLLERGDIFQRVFPEVGENPFHCTPHPFMQAVVVVE